jgi:hypothetical protein
MANRTDNLGEVTFARIEGTGSNADTIIYSENVSFKWKEKIVEGGLRLPFNLTSSRFFQNLSISNYLGLTQVTGFTNSFNNGGRIIPSSSYTRPYFFDSYVDGGKLIYNYFNLSYYSLLKRSARDINSKWGIALYLNAQNTPNLGAYSGKLFSFTSYVYLPGLFRHHSLWGYWAYQSSQILYSASTGGDWNNNYVFRNRIPLARGITVYRAEKMYSMSVNYTMPVWYPDIALGPILNIKRVRANAFMDYAFGDNPEYRRQFGAARPNLVSTSSYLSTGVEVKFDINVFRFMPELDLGFRYSYGIQPSASLFEFLLGTFNF